MRIVVAVSALGLLAGACATAGPTPPPPPDAMIAAPDLIEGRDWHLTRHGGQSSLVFGVAESDDVSLGLTCEDGSGQIHLFRDATDGEPREFRLEAGRDTARFAAESGETMYGDGQALSADANADHPVFRQFAALGWVAVWSGDERHGYAAHPGSEGRAAEFFRACG